MLNNAQLIHRLSVEERIHLILNKTILSTAVVGDYDFPTITLNEYPILKGIKDFVTATAYPSNQTLSQSWNEDLISVVNEKRGIESTYLIENSLYKIDGTVFGSRSFSEDPFLSGKILEAHTSGLKKSKAFASLDLNNEEHNTRKKYEVRALPLQMAMKANSYDMVIVDTVEDLRYWKEEYKHEGLFFARAKNELDIIRFFNAGATLISYEGDFEHAVEYVKEALRRYKNEKAKLDNKMIFENEYQNMLTDGKILSLENLNLACDRLINLMISLNKLHEEQNNKVTDKVYLRRENKAIEVEGHSKAAYDGAVESIVLLKNEGVLPLTFKDKCAFFGDAFENEEYYKKSFGINAAEFSTPFQLAGEYYEIDCEAFAHGYLRNQDTKQELLDAAVELANKVKTAVVYLYGEGEEQLPQEQLDLLKALSNAKAKIVAVIQSPCMVDLSFADMCAAIVYAGDLGQAGPKAILDVLTGIVNPSGKLTHSYPVLIADEHDTSGLPLYCCKDKLILYPFGHGLSYTSFDYHHLEINEAGVTLSITNNGGCAGYETVQVYVQKKNTKSLFKHKVLRGFKKVFVEKGETIKINIPFDEYTFRYYNVDKKGYGIEGGDYKIIVSNDSKTSKIEGILKLRDYIDERVAFETRKDKMLSEKELKEFVANKPKIRGYGFRIFVCILFLFYVTGFGGLIAYSNYIQSGSLIGTLVLGIIIFFVDILIIAKISKIGKERKKAKKEHINNNDENETLTLMVEKMADIEASDRVVYEIEELLVVEHDENLEELEQIEKEEAQPEEVLEEEVVEETPAVEEEEEEIVDLESTVLSVEEIALHEEEEIKLMEEQQAKLNADEGFKTYEKVVEFDTESSLSQAVTNFMEYAEYKGITIDINSVRSLLSGLGSSSILILNTRLKELMPLFIEVLNDYLGNTSHIVSANDTWMSSFNLTWKKEEDGTYSKTDFVNDIYNANILKNNINVAVLDNVNMKNVLNYLKEFVDYANYPSYSHSMRLNQKLVLKIPHNLKLVLIPQNDEYLNELPEELAKASISIELLMRKADHTVEEVKPNCLSYGYLEELIYDAKKSDFISEEVWKKLDDTLIELGLPELNNKTVLQIEKYTSVYISAGGEEHDAFDSVIAEKVLPQIKVLEKYKTYDGVKLLLSVIEKHFGHENINRISRVLNVAVKE